MNLTTHQSELLSESDAEKVVEKVIQSKDSRYKIIRPIAKGGMGSVSAVKDRSLSRPVAMKKMQRATAVEKLSFIEEARMNAKLEHPNIVPIHDIGINAANEVFYTMKLVEGHSLNEIIAKLRANDSDYTVQYNLTALLQIFTKVCEALSYAHSQGIIHLDIKPDNILIGNYGEVLIMDWGISRKIGDPQQHNLHQYTSDSSNLNDTINLSHLLSETTKNTYIVGTPMYMAPEQITDAPQSYDQRTDIYALGSLLYTLLTLHSPFKATNLEQVIIDKQAGALIPPIKRENRQFIPPELNAIVVQAMQVNKGQRYSSVKGLLSDINSFLQGRAVSVHQDSLFKKTRRFYKSHKTLCIASLITVAFIAILTTIGHSYYEKTATIRTTVYEADFETSDFTPNSLTLLNYRDRSERTLNKYLKKQGLALPLKTRVWLTPPAAGNVQVDVTFSWLNNAIDGFKIGINADTRNSTPNENDREAYTGQFGGWGGNISRLTRAQLTDDLNFSINTTYAPCRKNTRYKGTIKRIDNTVELYLNDKLILTEYDPTPLSSPQNKGIFLKSWSPHLRIHSVKVTKLQNPELISPIAIGDSFFNRKRFEDALDTYTNIYESYDSPALQQKALYKMALANYRHRRYSQFKQLKDSYKQHYPTSAELENLNYLESLRQWDSKQYRSALSLFDSLNSYERKKNAVSHFLINNSNQIPADIGDKLVARINDFPYFWSITLPQTGTGTLNKLTQNNCYKLELPAKSVTDIHTVTLPSKVRVLIIDKNNLTDLTPLQSLNLIRLQISNNSLKSLEPLRNMASLRGIFFENTPITSLEPLARCPINNIELNNTLITSIEALNTDSLITLVLKNTPLQSITPLIGAQHLKELSLLGTHCSDLEPLKNLSVESLELSPAQGMEFKNFETINTLPLLNLSISNTPIKDLSFIKDNNQLHSLTLNNSSVTDLETLFKHTLCYKSLRVLNLKDNPITDFSYLCGIRIKKLYISAKQSADLSFLTKMEGLSLLEINERQFAGKELQSLLKIMRKKGQKTLIQLEKQLQ